MRSHRSLALALSMFTLAAVALIPGSAGAVTGAAFTTTNTAADGTGNCKNGNEDVNCNIYDAKQYVWMNGGPSTAYVGDGSYFFAVTDLRYSAIIRTSPPKTSRVTMTPIHQCQISAASMARG